MYQEKRVALSPPLDFILCFDEIESLKVAHKRLYAANIGTNSLDV